MQSKLQNSKQQKRESKIRRGALCAPYFLKGIRNTEHGITLVALIITVIVLLILAIVSIRLVMNGGIIDKAEKGTESYSEAEIKEQIKLAYSEWQTAIWDGTSGDAGAFITARLQSAFGNDNVKNVSVSNGKVVAEIKTKGEFVKYSYDAGTMTLGIVEENNILLPDEYQQVEYLESTGTQYIDTGVYPTNRSYAKLTYLSSGTNRGLFGARRDTYNDMFGFYHGGNDQQGKYANSTSSTTQYLANNKYSIELSSEGYFVNNLKIMEYIESEFNTNCTFCLFAMNTGGEVNDYAADRIYECILKENNIIVRNFIPCKRKSDNKPGLYDIVNGVFYTNQGTGEFNLPLPSEYQQVQYLESTGEQYIDTEYKPTNTTRILTKMKFVETINNIALFGTRTRYDESDRFSIVQVGNETNIRSDFYNNGVYSIRKTTDELFIDKNKNYTTINGNTSSNNNGNFISNYNLLIFAMNDERNSTWLSKSRLYYLQIFNNDSLIRNFIPCKRKSDSKPGLYDMVNNVFYTNQGSGDDFTSGPGIDFTSGPNVD